MARLEIIQHEMRLIRDSSAGGQHRGRKLPRVFLPHRLWITGRMVGVIQSERVDVEIPQGVYEIRVQSMIPILESRAEIRIEEGVRNVMTIGDREKGWDMVFWIALVMEIVHCFLTLPRGWNVAYHIVDDGLFVAWLVYEWVIRKRYFDIDFAHYKN